MMSRVVLIAYKTISTYYILILLCCSVGFIHSFIIMNHAGRPGFQGDVLFCGSVNSLIMFG